MHKNGYPYEIPRGGTMDPEIIDDLQEKFEEAFKKYGMSYANNGVTTTNNNGIEIGLNEDGKIPVEVLFDPETKIQKATGITRCIRSGKFPIIQESNHT